MLAGTPGVKPDRLIRRFVMSAVGATRRPLTDDQLTGLVERAAEHFDASPSDLDHAIWLHQSGARSSQAYEKA